MGTLTIALPNGSQPQVEIADDLLVYDGLAFVTPDKANFVSLVDDPSSVTYQGSSLSFVPVTRAKVLAWDPNTGDTTDPDLIVEVNLSPDLVFMVTSNGTHLSYVRVTNL